MTGCKIGRVRPKYPLIYMPGPGGDNCYCRYAAKVTPGYEGSHITIAIPKPDGGEQIMNVLPKQVAPAKTAFIGTEI